MSGKKSDGNCILVETDNKQDSQVNSVVCYNVIRAMGT